MLACMVLFVPMVMAGWHLNCNKILFFSGALSSVSRLVNEVVWDMKPMREELLVAESDGDNVGGVSSAVTFEKNWGWSKSWIVMAM
ncbi:unnamed protein product [Linum trigynum]|uniref:Secreted protein n=1 Tax=Linum trigynum TaxID=586398 RepID=A0AAV2G5F6_9ROSI